MRMVQERIAGSVSLVINGNRTLTNRVGSVWSASGKHSDALAIELWYLHLSLQAPIIPTPQILQVSIAMEDVDDPAMAVALQAIKTGMWYAWPTLPLHAGHIGLHTCSQCQKTCWQAGQSER